MNGGEDTTITLPEFEAALFPTGRSSTNSDDFAETTRAPDRIMDQFGPAHVSALLQELREMTMLAMVADIRSRFDKQPSE